MKKKKEKRRAASPDVAAHFPTEKVVNKALRALFMHGMRVVTEVFQQSYKPEGKILVQLDLHRMCGTSGTGKSSSAEAAAKAMAA